MSHHNPNNICQMIVANNLCIGCGLCAAICPKQKLKIEFNKYGEYIVHEQEKGCPEPCGLCLRVCPFFDQPENEDTLGEKLFANTAGIKHSSQAGYYIDTFVGYSAIEGHRENGSSGGMATWMLEMLLKEKMVDYVACVSPTQNPQKLFKFVICSKPQEVRSCSRSSYYPVETSAVIEHILSNEGRYAIIALPCFCKSIRLAAELSPKLQRRVKFVLGLVCGQTKSKFFAEYICALGGGNPDMLEQFTFRIKDPNRPASDFGMRFACGASTKQACEKTVFWSEGIAPVWTNRYFTPNSCNFCDDIFAELADICFMDAWLPAYSPDSKGHNIILVRNAGLLDILNKSAKNGSISLKHLDISEAIESQNGVLRSKRTDIRERIRLAEKKGYVVPRKRLSLCNHHLSFSRKLAVKAQYSVSQKSRKEWLVAKKHLPSFHRRLSIHIITLRIAWLSDQFAGISKAIVRRLRKVLI